MQFRGSHRITRLCTGMALASLAALGLVVSEGASASGQRAVSNKPLVIDIAGEGNGPTTLDPAVDYDNGGYTFDSVAYSTLVRAVGSSSVRIEPYLARSWTESANGRTWTFHLRPGVKFQDGSPLNSQAVQFSFHRLLTIKQGGWADFACLKSISTPSPLTVVFHLNYPFSPFLEDLSNVYGADIVSRIGVLKHQVHGDLAQKWLYDHADGTGPYELVRWTHGQSIELQAFPGYWGGWSGHHVKKVIFEFDTVSSTIRLGLQNGSIDAAEGLDPQDFSALSSGASGVSVHNYPVSTFFSYETLNLTWGPLKNRDVRLALADSFDPPAIAKYVYGGYATPMDSLAPGGIPGYVAAPHPYSYNLAAAHRLLVAAGYAKGFTLPAVYFTGDTPGELTLELWASDLAKIGVTLSVKAIPYSEFAAIEDNPATSPPVIMNEWAEDYANSASCVYFQWLYSTNSSTTGNRAFYKNSTVDKLIVQGRGAPNASKALSLYRQMMGIVFAAAPYLPGVVITNRIALGPGVHGYQYDISDTQFYFPLYDMWLS